MRHVRPGRLVGLLLSLLVLVAPARGADELEVLATIPDLADIAAFIGGDRVDVTCVARGTENVHAVPLRPSSLVAANRADLFVQVGLSLEHAWVPGLLERARNRAIQPGQPGFINSSDGFPPIQVPDVISRSIAADLHPQGNPHINLDPSAGRHFADAVLTGLLRIDPGNADGYRARHAEFSRELESAMRRWRPRLEALAGRKVVAYHGEFAYLLNSAGIETVGLLEPQPGVPPTPIHLAQIVRNMRERGVEVILTAKWSNGNAVARVADETGARVLELPVMVRGAAGVDTWIGLIDHTLERLCEAFGIVIEEPEPESEVAPR